jgi:hypothetical protein
MKQMPTSLQACFFFLSCRYGNSGLYIYAVLMETIIAANTLYFLWKLNVFQKGKEMLG